MYVCIHTENAEGIGEMLVALPKQGARFRGTGGAASAAKFKPDSSSPARCDPSSSFPAKFKPDAGSPAKFEPDSSSPAKCEPDSGSSTKCAPASSVAAAPRGSDESLLSKAAGELERHSDDSCSNHSDPSSSSNHSNHRRSSQVAAGGEFISGSDGICIVMVASDPVEISPELREPVSQHDAERMRV
jgi:hypothetical protein